MKFRFATLGLELNNILGPATLLDPRFKTKNVSCEEAVKSVKDIIVNEINIVSHDEPCDTAPSPGVPAPSSSGKGLW